MNYYKVSAKIEFEDGFVYNTQKYYPFDVKETIDFVIHEEITLCNNALLKVEMYFWDYENNIVKIMDVTSNYNGGKID